jgi:peptidoglycan/xylan/chitin deacetylase (PgdA/CDA1 family)
MTQFPPILCYHQVVPWPLLGRPPLKPGLIVPLRRFRWQMALLRAWGYTGVSLRQWIDGAQGKGPLPRKPIILTFDDGYYGVHEYALPVLRRAGFTASVYIVAEDLTDAAPGNRAYFTLDRGRLRDLIDAGFEIGCHSLTHCRISRCTESELLREVVASREILERELGVEVRTFAYPYAMPVLRVIQCVRDQGYLAAVGVDASLASAGDLFALPRISLGYAQNMLQFIRRLRPGWRNKPAALGSEKSPLPQADKPPLFR